MSSDVKARRALGAFLWPPYRRVLQPVWKAGLRFSSHLRERDFWVIQAGVALITGLHVLVERSLLEEPWWGLHHLPVILYILPVSYASIKYSWEGGLLTGAWVTALVVPSIVLWHRESWMWLGELARVLVVVGVGVTLASRVQREARLRRRAEASEARFRALFEVAGDAIVVYNDRGAIVAANVAAAPFFGVDEPRLLVGKNLGAWVPSWRSDPPSYFQPPGGEQDGRARVTVMRADGHPLIADAVVAALPDVSEGTLFQAVFRDATVQEMREKGLRSLVHQVTQAQEEERERIARELHDDTLQALVLLTRELESLADTPEVPEEGRTRLARMASLAATSGEGLRHFSRGLRPSMLNDLGLVPALEWLTEDLSRHGTMETRFRAEGETRRLAQHIELALFRIAQEALRNVEKHAQASRVETALSFQPSGVKLTISDNGVGFAPPSNLEELAPAGKLGLVGLKERAFLLGGTLQLHTAPGKGTRLSVEIPE